MFATAASTGCWSGHAGDPQRASATRVPLPAEVWPPREIDVLEDLLANTPETISTFRLLPGTEESTLSEADRTELLRPAAKILDKGIFGYGLVRMYEVGDPITAQAETAIQGFTPNVRVLTSRGWNDADAVRNREAGAWGREKFNEFGSKLGLQLTGEADSTGLWAGVPVRIPPAVPGVTPVGVVMHYHSIAANPHEVSVLAEFARRGWVVIDFTTFAVVRAQHRTGTDEEILANMQAAQEMELRLFREVSPLPYKTYRQRQLDHPATERLRQLRREEIRLRGMTFQAGPGTDPTEVGRQMAREVDQQLAGNAYVGEAVIEYLYDRRPELKDLPLVVVGFSGGALAAPAVVARLGDRVDGLILIGGGADLLKLTQGSSLTDGGLTIRAGKDRVSPETVAAIHESYIKHVNLDPWTIAPTLGNLPVLNVYSCWDRIVPTSAAELLSERLGNPDRMVLRVGGHLMLFYLSPGKAKFFADWMERALGMTTNGK